MSTLYENIKSLCDERGIKGGKMCVDLGLSKSLMTGLKNGTKKSIQIETAMKIANYFSVPVDSILTPEPGTIDVDALNLDGKPELEIISEQKKEPVPTNGNGLSMYELRLLDWFRGLPAEKRQSLLSLADAPAELRSMKDHE